MNKHEKTSEIHRKFFESTFTNLYSETNDILESDGALEDIKLTFLEKICTIKDTVDEVKKRLKEVNISIPNDIDRLEYKIGKAVEKLRGALLVERNTSGTIFTTIMPLIIQHTNTETTTATISDNIVYGQSSETDITTVKPLLLRDLTINNLNIHQINKESLQYLENFKISSKTNNSKPIEFSINFKGLVKQTSNLILDLKEHAIIEIYKNGSLEKDKELNKKFVVPINGDVQSITIKCYPTIHKTSSVIFNKIGLSSLLYDKDTIYESKELPINTDLSYLAVDTCDNSDDSKVNIDYYISINGEDYETFAPTSKNKALSTQSVITVDKKTKIELVEINPEKVAEGDIRYYIPDNIQNLYNFEITCFLPNTKKIINKEIFIVVKEDTLLTSAALKFNSTDKIFIEGIEILSEEILLKKGIRSLVILDKYNNIISSNYIYILNIFGNNNIYINKVVKPVVKNGTRKYISFSIPELKDSSDLYGNIFIKGVNSTKRVATVKIKAVLQSKDKQTVPFITRILLRGL